MAAAKTAPTIFCWACICVFLLSLNLQVADGDDEVFAAMDWIREINQNAEQSVEDGVIVEEDIRLPPLESSAASGEFSNAMRFKSKLWPGAIVPYVVESSISTRPSHFKVLLQAMKIWEQNTCIRFMNRTDQSRYVRISYSKYGCYSSIGSMRTWPSRLSLGRNCDRVSVAVHELGHLLGFEHEQNRPDRDDYINILWENINPAYYGIFKKSRSSLFHNLGVQYDYNSVMHYGYLTFSKNGRPTMESRGPKVKYFGSIRPSELDIKQMNILYSCPVVPVFPDHFSLRTSPDPSLDCIAIKQPRDTEWQTKYLCYKLALRQLNITWSQNGRIIGQDCINTAMPYERTVHRWKSSFLCVDRDSLLKFRWSVSGPLRGRGCLEFRKTTRNRRGYFLCGIPKYRKIDGGWSRWSYYKPCSQKCGGGIRMRTRSCVNPVPKYGGSMCQGDSFNTVSCNTQRCPEWPSWPSDFKFMYISFTPDQEECAVIYERLQYREWKDARLCWPSNKRQITIRWSDQGVVPNMHCIRITQQNGRNQPNGWHDNYLCTNAPYKFKWSTNGPIKGLGCLKWQNNRFRNNTLWKNNYLCAEKFPVPTPDPSTGCLPHWQPFVVNRVTYCYHAPRLLFSDRLSWDKAQEYCREKNIKANLVSILSEEESKVVRSLTRESIWLGLKRTQTWRWVDSSPLSFTKWSRGEPNNGNGRAPENCGLLRGRDGKWNDFPCDIKFNYVCKMKGVFKT